MIYKNCKKIKQLWYKGKQVKTIWHYGLIVFTSSNTRPTDYPQALIVNPVVLVDTPEETTLTEVEFNTSLIKYYSSYGTEASFDKASYKFELNPNINITSWGTTVQTDEECVDDYVYKGKIATTLKFKDYDLLLNKWYNIYFCNVVADDSPYSDTLYLNVWQKRNAIKIAKQLYYSSPVYKVTDSYGVPLGLSSDGYYEISASSGAVWITLSTTTSCKLTYTSGAVQWYNHDQNTVAEANTTWTAEPPYTITISPDSATGMLTGSSSGGSAGGYFIGLSENTTGKDRIGLITLTCSYKSEWNKVYKIKQLKAGDTPSDPTGETVSNRLAYQNDGDVTNSKFTCTVKNIDTSLVTNLEIASALAVNTTNGNITDMKAKTTITNVGTSTLCTLLSANSLCQINMTNVPSGCSKIIVTVTGKQGNNPTSCTCEYTVGSTVVLVTALSIDQSSPAVTKGGKTTLTATITPSNATNKTITWTSDNPNVATVNSSTGEVTGVAAGSAVITAAIGSVTNTVTVTVTNEILSITMKKTSTTIARGSTEDLSVTYNPTDAENRSVTWTSSDSTTASVNNSGKISALKKGNATITATTPNGKEATCAVTVNVPVTSVTLNYTNTTIIKDSTITLSPTYTPSDADTGNSITSWSSSNTSIATVNSAGVVTGKAVGGVTITATTSNGQSATCSITVAEAGVDGWVGSASAGSISAGKTSFVAGADSTTISSDTDAAVGLLKWRVYRSNKIDYDEYSPTLAYSWITDGTGFSATGTSKTTTASFASRGSDYSTTTRSGTVKRRVTFTYNGNTKTIDSNSITITLAANTREEIAVTTLYGKPSTPTLDIANLTAAGGYIIVSGSVTNTPRFYYKYASGYSDSSDIQNKPAVNGKIKVVITKLCTATNTTISRFSIDTTNNMKINHATMYGVLDTDVVYVALQNADDTSKQSDTSLTSIGNTNSTLTNTETVTSTFKAQFYYGISSYIDLGDNTTQTINYSTGIRYYIQVVGTVKKTYTYPAGDTYVNEDTHAIISKNLYTVTSSKPVNISAEKSSTEDNYVLTLSKNEAVADRVTDITVKRSDGTVIGKVTITLPGTGSSSSTTLSFVTEETSITFNGLSTYNKKGNEYIRISENYKLFRVVFAGTSDYEAWILILLFCSDSFNPTGGDLVIGKTISGSMTSGNVTIPLSGTIVDNVKQCGFAGCLIGTESGWQIPHSVEDWTIKNFSVS